MKSSVVATFLDSLVLDLRTGDVKSLGLLVILQLLGVLHLLPFRLVQVALPEQR